MDISTCSSTTINSTQSNLATINTSFESQCPKTKEINARIIKSIYANLLEIIEENEQKIKKGKLKKIYDLFYLHRLPLIPLLDFMQKLIDFSKADVSVLIMTIMHIDNFCNTYNYKLNYHNIYLILLAVFILSAKFNEDIYINMKNYAQLIGISLETLTDLEDKMFKFLGFSLYIDSEYYQKYYEFFCTKIIDENKSVSSDY